jgi:hypothetical protein
MASAPKKAVDILAQLDAIASKDPVARQATKLRSNVLPDVSWLTKSSPLAPVGQTSNLLAQLDANPYINKALPTPKGPGQGAGALKNLLLPLQIIDTPRRAIISGIREIVDTMDGDPNTNASFGDFLSQTKDFSYGTGKAFPMKGWAGRIVGLIGDVALDPLTWATLGGTVLAKGTIKTSGASLAGLIEGGVENASAQQLAKIGVTKLGEDLYETAARKAIFGVKGSGRAVRKSVIGREGREKLAFFTQQRMEWMNKVGTANFSKAEIASAYKNIAAQGKQSLPDIIAKELGVRGPGVYYFGSRVKVPGTDVVGKFLERGITRTRLGLVNTSGIKSLHKAITPRGVGAIDYFGPDKIRDFRVGLANGSLTDEKAQLARFILNGDDLRRMSYSEADFNAIQRFGQLREEVMKPENNIIRHLLDNVETVDIPVVAAARGATPEQLDIAQKFRAVMLELHELTDEGWQSVVPDHVIGFQKGYLPHNTTELGVQLMDEVRTTPAMAGLLPDDGSAMHMVGNFRQRGLGKGSPFFGTILKEEDLTIDKLNFIVERWLLANGRQPFEFFDTDMANIVPAYIRGHANMMSNVAMMNEFKKNPDFVRLVDGYLGIAPEYVLQMHKNSAQAFEDVLTSLQNLHGGLRDSLDVLRKALTEQHGSFDAALQALKNPDISEADVAELLGHLNTAMANAATKHADMVRAEGIIPGILPNTDGFGVYAKHAVQSDSLQKRFEELTQQGLNLRSDPARFAETPGEKLAYNNSVAKFLTDFEKYTEDAALHARAQQELMEVSAYLAPLADSGPLQTSGLYAEVINVVRKLGVGQPVVPTKAVHTLEQIDSTLVRLGETGSRDIATLSPVVESLRVHLKERFPAISEKIDGILDDVKLQAVRPDRSVPTEKEIESFRKSATAAMERQRLARLKLDKATEASDKVDSLKSEVAYFEKQILEQKERLKVERAVYNKARKRKVELKPGEVANREYLQNLAQARTSLTQQEEELKQLYSSLRATKNDLEVAKGPIVMGKSTVESDLQAATFTWNKTVADTTKRETQYTAALDLVKSGVNRESDYMQALTKVRVLVAQQKTSIEVAHLREVFAYYGVDLGDSITQDVFRKNTSLIRAGQDFGRYVDDSVRVEMEIIDLQKISDDLAIRLNESPLRLDGTVRVRPAVKRVEPRATKVVDPEVVVEKAQNDLNELLQSPEYMLAKSAKNRTNSLMILSQLNGSQIDWSFGGIVAAPKLETTLQMGGENFLEQRLSNVKFWNNLFIQHEQVGPIVSAITDWAHNGRVLAITNPDVLAREGADNISHERALHYLIDYIKELDAGEGRMIAGNEMQASRTKPISRWWDVSGHSNTFKKETELNALVVAKPIEGADAVRIADAQKIIDKNVAYLKAYESGLKAEAAQASVDAVYVPAVLDDSFAKFEESSAGLRSANAEEIKATLANEDANFGSAVDAEINDVAFGGSDIVDYRSLKNRQGELGYRGDGTTPDAQISRAFERTFATVQKDADAIDDVIVHTPLEQKSREQLTHEIETLTKMRNAGLETTEIKSKNIRTMIKVRQDALGIERGAAKSRNNLPVSMKLRMKPKRVDGSNVIDPNTNQVVMVEDIRPSEIGTYRRYDDGTASGRLFLRKEDMRNMKPADRFKRAQQVSSTDKWVEVRYRPITADDEYLFESHLERLEKGFFPIYQRPGDTTSPVRWMKSVEYGDEQWMRSSSEYGFSSEQANSFGAVLETADAPDLLGVTPRIRESIYDINPPPPKPMTASEEAVDRLQRDLENISSTVGASNASTKKAVTAARSANTKAQNLVDKLQAQFDSVKGLVQPHDPAAVASLEARLAEVQDMIYRTQRGVAWDRSIRVNKTVGVQGKFSSRPLKSGRTAVRNRVAGTSREASAYNYGMKTLDEGIEMLRTFGTRGPGFEHLENIAQRQIQLQAEYEAAVAVLGHTEVEERLMAGLQNSILKMNEFGDVTNGAGNVVGSFPSSNVYKFFPDLEDGWQYLSRGVNGADGIKGAHGIYPGLAGSPEFVALWNQAKRFEDPEYLRQMHKYVGSYTKFFKAYATMTPGFHVRNGLANAVKLVFMGAEWKNMMEATPLYLDWMKASRAGSQFDDWVLTKPLDIQESLRIARKSMFGSGGGIFTVDFKDAVGGSRLWDNKLVRFNAKWGQESDNYSRFVLGYDSARSGMDVGMAQARTKRAFFDYEDLSQVDEVMRQIVPFWLWTSRNLIFELQNQWLNPKPYQIYASIMRNMRDPDYDPSEYPSKFVKEIGGIKLPFGDSLYLTPDLGFTRTSQQLTELFDPIRYTNNFNPLLKIPLEEFLGKSVFTGKTLDTPKERLIHILKGVVPPVQMGDRLIGSEGDAAKNAWLSTIGSPVRTYQTKEK